jgi:Amt family ammonium transporter
VFADAAFGGVGYAEGVTMLAQVGKQAMAILVTCAWSGGVTAGSFWLISRFTALRVDAEGETDGLDLTLHDERGYNL